MDPPFPREHPFPPRIKKKESKKGEKKRKDRENKTGTHQ
jgi:hypothetical protein